MNIFNKAVVVSILLSMLPAAASAAQSSSYTYDSAGHILTQDGPRTDLNDVTIFTYDSIGNRASETNPLGQVTRYTSYDAEGNLLAMTDANGVNRSFTYGDRGRLMSSTLKHPSNSSLDAVTQFSYDAVGQLVSMTFPNGYQLSYEYDAAHRLTAIKNPAGERIEYTLDAAGNRTQQRIKNNAGNITYSAQSAFDELSRVISITGNHGQVQQQRYDTNDNNIATINGRGNSTQQRFDELNRVAKQIDPALGETTITYDNKDRISSITDARNLVTRYSYDGLGNLVSQTSPDTGTTTFIYDDAGNRLQSTDARGVVVNYRYDALNRLISVSYPAAASENVTYSYDNTANGNFGVGRLTGISSAVSTLGFSYNHAGLLTQQQASLNGITFTTQYRYDLSGSLTGIIYPSGRIVNYVRDSAGRVQTITTQDNATASTQPLFANITYLPFGPANSYSLGNGLTHNLSYDSDYRMTATQVSGVLSRGYGYDLTDNITGISNLLDTTKSQNFAYDALDRLTAANGIYGRQTFSYDSVGNRTSMVSTNGTTVTNDTYSYSPNNNWLLGISRTVGGVASGTRSFNYDLSGNRLQGTAEDASVQSYTYTKSNRLNTVKVGTTALGDYAYNALGQRVSKTAGSLKELYFYDMSGHLLAVSDSAGKFVREYVYNDNQLVTFIAVTNPKIPSLSLMSSGATFQGSVGLEKLQTGYTGTVGYVHFSGEGQVSWPFTIVTGTTYTSTLHYSLVGTDRPLAFLIDGVQQAIVNFPATTNLNTWGSARVNVTLSLPAGNHTLTLKSTGSGGPNIDWVGIGAVSGQTAAPIGTPYFIHSDHLGTPQVITNKAKAVVWAADYQPFGKATLINSSIELYSRFPGQFVDSESGLYYNYFRDYDPSIGRYIESDPIGLGGGINTYGYAYQNPIKNIDRDGRFVFIVIPGICAAGGCEALGGLGALLLGWWATHNSHDDTPKYKDTPHDDPDTGKFCPPKDDDGCAEERRACSAQCADLSTDPNGRKAFGGSIAQCIKNCLPERCGGEPKWKGYIYPN